MKDGLLDLAQAGSTTNSYLVSIYQARMINSVMGYGMVSPWDVNHIPENWLAAFEGIAMDLPRMRSKVAEIETIKNKWRTEYKQRYRH